MKQVQIAKVNGSTCIDATGKELIRIGNMNVRAGDVVWTDGRCIYGNMMHNTEPEISFANSSDMKAPGIPLYCSNGNLLIYTKNHKIYRYSPVTDYRSFVNNDKFCGLASVSGITSDMDIDGKGNVWEIKSPVIPYQLINEVIYKDKAGKILTGTPYYMDLLAGAHFHGGSKVTATYTWDRASTSEAVASNNWVDNDSTTEEADYSQSIFIDVQKKSYSNEPISIKCNGATVKNINLEKYIERTKSRMAEISKGSTGFPDCLMDARIYVLTAHIDDKGKWQAIIRVSVHERTYKDYPIKIYICNKHVYYRYVSTGKIGLGFMSEKYCEFEEIETYTYKTSTALYAVPYSLDGEITWLISDDEVTEISAYISCYRKQDFSVFDHQEVGWSGKNLYHKRKWEQDWYWYWINVEETFERGEYEGPPSQVFTPTDQPESINFSKEYFFPIQDKFSYKSNNRNVYKNGNKLLEFPYGVDAITPINVAKNEYLILSGSVPYVYKNGSFTQVQWNGKNFYPLNKRVRYMSQLQNLKNAYTK